MKVMCEIGPNPHRTESDEYIIVAKCEEIPDYSQAIIFNSDDIIKMNWIDWDGIGGKFDHDLIEEFNSYLHDKSHIFLQAIQQFIDDRIKMVNVNFKVE